MLTAETTLINSYLSAIYMYFIVTFPRVKPSLASSSQPSRDPFHSSCQPTAWLNRW